MYDKNVARRRRRPPKEAGEGGHPASGRPVTRDDAETTRRRHLVTTVRWLGPLALALLVFATQEPVYAACVRGTPAFSAGTWKGELAEIRTSMTDTRTGDLYTLNTEGVGSFVLEIEDTGEVGGTFAFDGLGTARASEEDDWSAAQWEVLGELGGTPSYVTIDGEMELVIGGEVDVNPGDGPDEYSGSGQSSYGYGLEIDVPYTSEFSAWSIDCHSASGEMTSPVGFPDWAGESPTTPFYAVRVGSAATPDVEGQLVGLLDEAEQVLTMAADPETFDSDALGSFLLTVLRFDALLVSLESCNPDGHYEAGPAWETMRNVVLKVVTQFVYAAQEGAYDTRDVIRVMGVMLQSGILAWNDESCLAPGADDSPRQIWRMFEGVLVERLGHAIDNGDTATVAMIVAAAHQYGLVRILEIVGEGGVQ
jgi:hypothetical protein